jgi:hypothetical protein
MLWGLSPEAYAINEKAFVFDLKSFLKYTHNLDNLSQKL